MRLVMNPSTLKFILSVEMMLVHNTYIYDDDIRLNAICNTINMQFCRYIIDYAAI